MSEMAMLRQLTLRSSKQLVTVNPKGKRPRPVKIGARRLDALFVSPASGGRHPCARCRRGV